MIYDDIRLETLLRDLGSKEITSVLIEGGGEILGQALDQHLIDKIQVYVAPIFTGGLVVAFAGAGANSSREAPRLERVRYAKIGHDICVSGVLATTRLFRIIFRKPCV